MPGARPGTVHALNILALGRDGGRDGGRDLRGSLNDAFLSCGNYLRHPAGGRAIIGSPGRRLPGGFPLGTLAGPDIVKTAADAG